jgi:hypothetical protein
MTDELSMKKCGICGQAVKQSRGTHNPERGLVHVKCLDRIMGTQRYEPFAKKRGGMRR